MKKFTLVCFIIFIAGIGCTKVAPLCGCSPPTGAELMLVVKNSAGDDLLNSKTPGAFSKDKIQLFQKDANGNEIQVSFGIFPPSSSANDNFKFYTLYHTGFSSMLTSGQGTFYLKFADEPAHVLDLLLDKDKLKLDKLLIDNKEAEKQNGAAVGGRTVFYLTK